MLTMDKLRKNVLSLITIVVIIIAYLCQIFIGEFDVFQTIVLLAIIPLCIAVIFEHKSSFEKIENRLEKILSHIPKDSITAFRTHEECVDEVERLCKKATHFYFASLDYIHRAPTGRDKLSVLKDKFAVNKKIEYRYLFYPTDKRLEDVRKNIINGNTKEKNSFYASVNVSLNKTKGLSFAAFMIIDKKHIIVRSPFKNGNAKPYMLITHHLLCDMFISWFDMMWDEAEKIDNEDNLERYIEDIKKSDMGKSVVC